MGMQAIYDKKLTLINYIIYVKDFVSNVAGLMAKKRIKTDIKQVV